MSHVKLVDSDRGRIRVPWWYPYGAREVDTDSLVKHADDAMYRVKHRGGNDIEVTS